MSQSRIEAFRAMLAEQPEEGMIWYGLASEYFKLGLWGEAAEALASVLRFMPDNTAAYQMLGTALANQGKPGEARRVWAEGIETATRKGAWSARQHMERLLAETEPGPDSGFCAK